MSQTPSALLMSSSLAVPGSCCPAQPHALAGQSWGESPEPKDLGGSAEQLLEAGKKPRAGAQAAELERLGKPVQKGL